MKQPMRIAIVGSGALGGLYGAFLARGGADVHFLMRRDYQTVKSNGLKILSCTGNFNLPKVNCYSQSSDIGPCDLVFIGLKTTANDQYQTLISPLLSENTRILTAQNGLGNEHLLADLFGPQRIAGGLAFLCSNRIAPGTIEHLDYGQLRIGNYQRQPDQILTEFARLMNNGGGKCLVIDDLNLARWQKLEWNVPFNGLSAWWDMTTDKIIADPERKALAARLMREVQTAAKACGSIINKDFLDKMMTDTEKMKPYYTSMHLDRRQHRPLEIESIIGEPLRRGQAHGLNLPEMTRLYQGLKDITHEA